MAVIVTSLLLVLLAVPAAQSLHQRKLSYLEAGSLVDYVPVEEHYGFYSASLRIYCYRGVERSLRSVFESATLTLMIDNDDYFLYQGSSPAAVYAQSFDIRVRALNISPFASKRTKLQISPFVQQCVGIDSATPYRLQLKVLRIDPARLAQLMGALALLFYAGWLSCNAVFYYTCTTMLGVCTSFMLVVWVLARLIAHRILMFGVLVTGWTIGLCIFELLHANMHEIVHNYPIIVVGYVSVAGLSSFFACYKWCPSDNQLYRTALKWLLQLGACWLIYTASNYKRIGVSIIGFAIAFDYYWRMRKRRHMDVVAVVESADAPCSAPRLSETSL